MNTKILILAMLLPITSLFAQKTTDFSGMVVNENDEALIGATVNWQDTTIAALTDVDGWFVIPRLDTINTYFLEINYVGYETAIVEILPDEDRLKLIVQENASIQDITVEATQRSSFNSTLNPINVETLGHGELRRAACCNLSESFENNATVNVSFADAVTGAKEIEMLGLRGTYTQMQIENQPAFNRLGRAYGLEYIPGTFISSIQIAKGASTVRNGVQGITGQINTELIKPYDAPLLFLNFFANRVGRLELNAQFNYELTRKWSTGLLVHGNYYGTEIDFNEDSFLDIPKKKQLNAISRWIFRGKDLHIEINAQGIWDSRNGGQTLTSYQNTFDTTTSQLYQINSEVRRVGLFGKIGYLGFKNPSQSLAILFNGNIHEHKSYFGNRQYDGLQKQLYTNLVFQTGIINKKHNLATGLTYDLIDFKEQFTDINNDRTEHTASAFAEYDFTHQINEEKGSSFTMLLGVRGDLLATNTFTKLYASPRVNFKYNFTHDIVVRASAGRGIRNPNVFIENIRFMPNHRDFVLQEQIMPEVAWNYGLNFVWNFKLSPIHEGSLSIDAYRTDFENQLITDIDSDHNSVQFYNLKGQSFANSILVAYTQTIFKGFEAKFAYKFNDVRMTIGNQLQTAPLLPQHRGLISLNYHTPKKDWEFNVSMNIIGTQRMPHAHAPFGDIIYEYRVKAQAPAYVMLNAHINKFFKGGWQVYVGAENMTNYTQKGPIMGYQDPFGKQNSSERFDASSVYAPVFGIQVYAGVKYTLEGKKRFAPISTCGADHDHSLHTATEEHNEHDGHDHSSHETEDSTEEHHDHGNHENMVNTTISSSTQCGMCQETLEKALSKIEGIYHAHVDLATSTISVDYDTTKTDLATIEKAITAVGYDANEQKANKKAYNKLPGCCKKP